MGHTPSNETTTLLPHKLPSKPLKFPLGLVSEGVRPYLELIRLEKVKATVCHRCIIKLTCLCLTADWNHSHVLALRCVICSIMTDGISNSAVLS